MPNHDRFECQTVIDSDAILHSWQQTQLYLENGNFFMAKSVLEKILERQDNLRQ